MERLINIGKAAELLGVTKTTLRTWNSEGKVDSVRTEGGHRRFRLSDIQRLQGIEQASKETRIETAVVYCRVSSREQKIKGDLERQKGRVLSHCANQGYYTQYILEEVSSGMSDNRPKLKKLFALVASGQVDRVVVEHQDRLTRFMFKVFESFFASHDVELECVEEILGKSHEEELVEDMLMLMSSFSAKIYGKRSAKLRRKKKEQLDG